ncbi:hypothetical protein EPUS_08377 [Endocarpon pusillum Z07020]|uniref:PNPLA domain-containing protein n=1 Tax=Endocarpon pusillum (strain Z07020 / HMAS-L-300199) TaxID=1263415 RepID=U1FW04_ENDPU|nr:uncharacterized protein EPUS_08377 [Endocarpon pusillum Z07020]ERF69027.1 hypothetical protein EPUS_08377 [Endocarpon pusillum Z07020]
MAGINIGRPLGQELQPWQAFDIIGGTSTGGYLAPDQSKICLTPRLTDILRHSIIAIMLGCLRMTIRECQDTYKSLSEAVFTPKRGKYNGWRAVDFLRANEKFDSKILEDEIKKVIAEKLQNDETLLSQANEDCKVFVCAVHEENTSAECIRSYKLPGKDDRLSEECKIWEACRATSAATTFFAPCTIGPFGQKFVDGGIRHNNPVNLVAKETAKLWPNREVLLLSVGTGVPPDLPFQGNLISIAKRLKDIANETEEVHELFYNSHKEMVRSKQYFRFNVPGMGGIGLEEWQEIPRVASATQKYLSRGNSETDLGECVDTIVRISQVSKEALELIDTISPLTFSDKHDELLSKRTEGTGNWFLESPIFTTWASASQSTLWCPGIPGAGKSVMMYFPRNEGCRARVPLIQDRSTAANQLSQAYETDPHVGIAWIYCDYKDAQTLQTSARFLLAFWKQLVLKRGTLSDDAKAICQQTRGGLRAEEALRLLDSECRKNSKTFLMVDALDECTDQIDTQNEMEQGKPKENSSGKIDEASN